ncbi:hypothetical protein J2W42_002201 [Rhizobium tibeticum]|uniref:phage tail assembly chaperone n=1 Tax=Rhizobium tibeticum TaxID=501024 RepID=UPI00278007F7|nr:hypothetical protein [Rhizobium tibeticum]MDP9809353.1 hypothetical protein [Rhizobium tibeticum]
MLGERLSEAVAVIARYDTVKDSNGETRRERNEAFEIDSPDVDVPDNGAFLWSWFWELRQCQAPGFSGPAPISNLELATWCQITGNIIRREEVTIMRAMDGAFRAGVDAESEAIRAREKPAE